MIENNGVETDRNDSGFGPKLLNTEQVAEMLNVSESWVREHSLPNGPEPRVPSMKLGAGKTAAVRFHPADIQAFVEEQRRSRRAKSRWKS
jgi:predicted DNA-binding transcriptional regulator AlpA